MAAANIVSGSTRLILSLRDVCAAGWVGYSWDALKCGVDLCVVESGAWGFVALFG